MTLPTPQGYYRIDGKNDKIDSILRASVGAGVRLIVCYGSEVALAETLSGKMSSNQGMNFQAGIGTRLEKISVPLEKFKKLKAQISEDSKAFVEGLNKQQMEQTGSKAMSILRSKTVEMKVGEMVSLGVDNETEESISFSSLMKLEATAPDSTNKVSTVFVLAQSIIWVRNRVITLTCTTAFSTGPDIESARKNLKEWKDSLLLLNRPAPAKP